MKLLRYTILFFLSIVSILIVSCSEKVATTQDANPETTNSEEEALSGPYLYENLAVFLVHGENAIKDDNLLTLDEALDDGKIIVHETGDVNELSVENISNSVVFIQAGDIVKGGKQDRVFQDDLVVPAKSGKLPIAAFCVEQGRWAPRADEDQTSFGSSKKYLSSKELRLAAKSQEGQSAVWKEVQNFQEKIKYKLNKDVTSEVSPTSLQLTVENEDIKKTVELYTKEINDLVKDKENVIGAVFVINGEVVGADVYASSVLFKKLWPKMLDAYATEALADLNQGESFDVVSEEKVNDWLFQQKAGNESEKRVAKGVSVKSIENDSEVVSETYGKKYGDKPIRKNYIKK